MTVIFTYLQQN